jgi:RNA polymerase sigma factor (sigma-70 family)
VTNPANAVLNYLRRVRGPRAATDMTDRALLERFAGQRDEAAFAELVRLHGPAVLGVCRRVLGDAHDAEDAFQVTFQVLAAKGRSLRPGDQLGPWLYGVAYRSALRARSKRARRRERERQAPPTAKTDPADDILWRDLRPVLDEEVQRLPEKYRVPFVLCHVQGQTYEEAAHHLGCPKGTVAIRLSRARERLRNRLTRRGLSPSVVFPPLPSVPNALAMTTAHAATLAQGEIMFAYKMIAAVALVLSLTAIGASGYVFLGPAGQSSAPQKSQAPPSLLAADGAGDKGAPGEPVPAALLKKYHVGDRDVEMDFEPEQAELVLGEPVLASFVVKNVSNKPFTYVLGGDQRGTGRHDHFKITALDSQGTALPDPKADKNGSVADFGGIAWLREVKAGATDRLPLDLGQFRTFKEPGVYTVTCRFDLFENHEAKKAAATVETTFKLKILPATEENVKRVIARLVEQAGRSHKEELNTIIDRLCTFAGKRVVSELATMCVEGDPEHRTAALGGLSRFTTPEAEATVLKALRDPDTAIRAAAAAALGEMKTDAAVDALLARLSEEKPVVASALLRALGRTQSPRAFERLEKALTDDNAEVRRAATAGLALFGGERAITALKRCAEDEDVGRREAVLQALERLNQPLRPEWVLPLIIAGRGYGYTNYTAPNPNEALRLLRLYGGERAIVSLVSCIDFENPAVRSYYNYNLFATLAAMRDAPKATWNNDPNADGTPAQIEENQQTLKRLRSWLGEKEKTPRKDGDDLEKLIVQLGDDDFKQREAASKALEAKATAALPLLLRAAALAEDTEIRSRARRIVDKLERRWISQF